MSPRNQKNLLEAEAPSKRQLWSGSSERRSGGVRLGALAPWREIPRRRAALTLVEVVVSTLIVGMMTVAALNALAAATRSSVSAGNRAIALGMADQLMAEILAVEYSDPDGSAVFGLETGEAAPRINFDDVDDFHGWNCQPPQYRSGAIMADRADWRQRVTVQRAVPANPDQTATGTTDSGAKRIRVWIEYDGTVLAEQYFVRTDTE